MRIILIIISLFIIIYFSLYYMNTKSGELVIDGFVIDKDTKKGIPNAFVQVFSTEFRANSFNRLPDAKETLEEILITDEKGYFKTKKFGIIYNYKDDYSRTSYYKIILKVAKHGYYSRFNECNKILKQENNFFGRFYFWEKKKVKMNFDFIKGSVEELKMKERHSFSNWGNSDGITNLTNFFLEQKNYKTLEDKTILYYFEHYKFMNKEPEENKKSILNYYWYSAGKKINKLNYNDEKKLNIRLKAIEIYRKWKSKLK